MYLVWCFGGFFVLVSWLVWGFWFWTPARRPARPAPPPRDWIHSASKILLAKCFKGEIMQHNLHRQNTEVKRLMFNKD